MSKQDVKKVGIIQKANFKKKWQGKIVLSSRQQRRLKSKKNVQSNQSLTVNE